MNDSELLKKYFEGRLSEKERNLLEKRALDDPFLQDAMQGFSGVEGSFEVFTKKQQTITKKFHSFYLVLGSILTIGLVAILVMLSPEQTLPTDEIVQHLPADTLTNHSDQELEIIPESIDTLIEVPYEEQIKAEEVVHNKAKIQQKVNYPEKPGQNPILVEENILIKEDFKLEPEDVQLQKIELVPATYLHDLFVVDYRRIDRERVTISVKRFELGGVSAQYENENTQNTSDLVERQVDVPYFEYLNETMEAFADGAYKKALNRYLIILEQYPEDANALFYGGLCYYNLGKYTEALAFFDKIRDMSLNAFKEEATWYKAKTLLKKGEKSAAKALLEDIIAGGGFYVEDAISLRKKL